MLRFGDVIYRIYEATLSPDHWAAALDGVAELSRSAGALIYAKGTEGWFIPLHSARLDAAIKAYQGEEWWKRNPWLARLPDLEFQVGDVYADRDVVAAKDLNTDPFYTEFLPRFDLGWQMAAVLHSEIGSPTSLVVQRAKAEGAYTGEEMNTLRLISLHLEQSLRITATLVKERNVKGSLSNAFDKMDQAAFIVDQEQHPLLINRPARGLLGRYFNHTDGKLKPALRQEHGAFAAALKSAHAVREEDDAALPRPTTISDVAGNSPLAVWTLPVVGASADQLGLSRPDSHVLVLAQPLEQNRVIDPRVLRSLFDLTLGEARLAALVGAGVRVKQAAEDLGITEGTARVVLKRVFQKLKVGRQSELAAKLAKFAR